MPRAPKPLPRPTTAAAAADRRRGTTTERGYGHDHRVQRARLLALHPLCQRCRSEWSCHLHHRDRNPFNRADSNCEMLCERCHQAEHGGR